MKSSITDILESIPSLMQHTSLNVNLQGWPAAVAVIAIGISSVSICAIQSANNTKEVLSTPAMSQRNAA